ncbi:WD40/YVTN/BNR-like repeat-containing protein [Niabella insulamsoli]|uniref:WD40/YVTN/BNR-like repeat-containing protein n=1 Tax=Niabella insulamsoli TaxID=3144874 RepID=UPI0031FD7359
MKAISCIIFFLCFLVGSAQEIKISTTESKVSFRGLSVYKNTVWVGGSQGTVGRSLDNGATWQWLKVPGFEKQDFRDIEAFDDQTAIIMAIASPAYILKTQNGGKTWAKVYENQHPDIFLDAMAFKSSREGIVIGDPIKGRFFVAETIDGGASWRESNRLALPPAHAGEAFFAASGSNIVWGGANYWIASGGLASRVFFNSKAVALPTLRGQQMTGANGMAVRGRRILIAAGDYTNLTRSDSSFVYSADGGKTWKIPNEMPSGYRSGVCFISKQKAITCGMTGVDITADGGRTWKKISNQSFNACAYNEQGKTVHFAGNNGRVGKLQL